MEIRVLATREVGLVIIKFRSITGIVQIITGVSDCELTINSKPEVAGDEDVAKVETGSLVNSS